MKMKNGFTLVELMITVAIVGILSAIAYPSYTEYMTSAKLPEATVKLANAKNKMEHYFQDNRTYDGACESSMLTGSLSNSDNFKYSCEENGDTFLLKAVGTTKQVLAFEYTIDDKGAKETSKAPSNFTAGNCWVMKKTGC